MKHARILVWLDTRTHSTMDEMLAKCNNNPNYLKVIFKY